MGLLVASASTHEDAMGCAVEQLLFFKLQLKEVKEVKINGFFQRLEKLKAARDFRFQYFVRTLSFVVEMP